MYIYWENLSFKSQECPQSTTHYFRVRQGMELISILSMDKTASYLDEKYRETSFCNIWIEDEGNSFPASLIVRALE